MTADQVFLVVNSYVTILFLSNKGQQTPVTQKSLKTKPEKYWLKLRQETGRNRQEKKQVSLNKTV